MMWVLIIIVALIALPVIIGFSTPVRYEGRVVVEYEEIWATARSSR